MWVSLQKELLDWYDVHRRDLPWRRERTPYTCWISEMMLQQTRVDTVIPYYERWMKRFPNAASLAEAEEEEVLRLWEGLGYYSRARSLHKAARVLMERHGGEIPADAAALRKLPGIGPYTAGAIVSTAFQLPEAALDGNIRRVYSRLFDVGTPVREPETEKRLWQIAREQLDLSRPGDYNEALMDLGAGICVPGVPDCLICPLREACLACERGTASERPVQKAAPAVPHYEVTAAVIQDAEQGTYLMTRRPAKGLLGGMWEFPGGKREAGESLEECLIREIREELGVRVTVGASVGTYRHAYTHFKVTLHAFRCGIVEGVPRPLAADGLRWVTREEMESLPMGKIDRAISRDIRNESVGPK